MVFCCCCCCCFFCFFSSYRQPSERNGWKNKLQSGSRGLKRCWSRTKEGMDGSLEMMQVILSRAQIYRSVTGHLHSVGASFSGYALNCLFLFQITLADLTFQNWLDFPEYQMKVNLDLSKYPKLQAHKKRVESHPKIAAWIAKRPS